MSDNLIRFPGAVAVPLADINGVSLQLVDDPLITETNLELLNFVMLPSNFIKLPYEHWCRITNLFKSFVEQQQNCHFLEVGVKVYFKIEGETPQFKCVVPGQSVTSASIDYDLAHAIDLLDGKETNIDEIINEGFNLWGTVHSHPGSLDRPSSIDDGLELNESQVCIICSHLTLNTDAPYYKPTVTLTRPYDARTGATQRMKRFFNIPSRNNLHWSMVIDATPSLPAEQRLEYDFVCFPPDRPELMPAENAASMIRVTHPRTQYNGLFTPYNSVPVTYDYDDAGYFYPGANYTRQNVPTRNTSHFQERSRTRNQKKRDKKKAEITPNHLRYVLQQLLQRGFEAEQICAVVEEVYPEVELCIYEKDPQEKQVSLILPGSVEVTSDEVVIEVVNG